MTDNEIIKVMKMCLSEPCSEQAYINAVRNALFLINRRDAEIERLQKECEITRAYIHNNGLEWGLVSHLEFYKNQRAEAIKEFAERLKEEQEFFVNDCDDFVGYVAVGRIDNLVKEMENETK